MDAADPTARTAYPLLEFRDNSPDVVLPRLRRLDGDRPADPLVASERRYVFPGRKSFWGSKQSLLQIRREVVNCSA